jgi:hypothetical protein
MSTIQLFNGQASMECPPNVVELEESEKMDLFGRGEVPQHAYGLKNGHAHPMIWSIQLSELPAEPQEMENARRSYRADLEDFFDAAEWLTDTTVAKDNRDWELLEFRTTAMHRWVYLTSWQGRILSCEFNAFDKLEESLVEGLFQSLKLG